MASEKKFLVGGKGRCGMMGGVRSFEDLGEKGFQEGSVSSPGKVRRVDLI